MVRAKFKCSSKTRYGPEVAQVDVTLDAINEKDGDNAAWSKWTPSGTLKLCITNPAAHEQIEPGRYYFIDIAPAL